MMNSLPLSPSLIDGLGWTIVHSLWQATALAGVLWVLSRAITAAKVRYRLAYGTLLAQVVVSVATFFHVYAPAVAGGAADGTSLLLVLSGREAGAAAPASVLPTVVVVWALAVVVGTLRLGWSFGRVRRMRRKGQKAVPAGLAQRVQDLALRIGYTAKVSLALNDMVDGPALIGHFKPLILFPVSLLNQLTPEEAEAVILHELAHLQRRDHWWNLLQCLIEVVFQYHPVVWWIGARIREEREHCCDDIVLDHGPGGLPYARALLYFETQRAAPRTAVALTNKPGGLLGRVQRFLHQQNIPYQMKSRLFLLPVLALLTLVGTAAYSPTGAETAAETAAVNCTASVSHPAPAAAPTAPEPRSVPAAVDTLPRGRHQVSSYRNGKSTEFIVEDGKIKSLKIDGREIPEAEHKDYEPMVEDMLSPRSSSNSRVIRQGYVFPDMNLGEGDFELPEIELDDLEFPDLEGDLEEIFRDYDVTIGQFGEDIGEVLGGAFHVLKGIAIHTDSLPGGSRFLWRTDSTAAKGGRFFFHQDEEAEDELNRFFRQQDREAQRFEEEKIREMETMIERLEREKAQMKRQLERRKNSTENLRESQERVLREAERLRTEELARIRRQASRAARHHSAARTQANLARERAERLPPTTSATPGMDMSDMIKQLQREGLISGEPVRKLVVDNKKLKINGKRATTAAHARFLELSKGKYGGDFKVAYNNSES